MPKSQPRIPGLKRVAGYACFHPVVKQVIRSIARRENRSISWVIAEFVSMGCGVDIRTGKRR